MRLVTYVDGSRWRWRRKEGEKSSSEGGSGDVKKHQTRGQKDDLFAPSVPLAGSLSNEGRVVQLSKHFKNERRNKQTGRCRSPSNDAIEQLRNTCPSLRLRVAVGSDHRDIVARAPNHRQACTASISVAPSQRLSQNAFHRKRPWLHSNIRLGLAQGLGLVCKAMVEGQEDVNARERGYVARRACIARKESIEEDIVLQAPVRLVSSDRRRRHRKRVASPRARRRTERTGGEGRDGGAAA